MAFHGNRQNARNEKYMGDALQKTYTVDFMTKKKKSRTLNQNPQICEDDHEVIIPKELFYRVQEEMMRAHPGVRWLSPEEEPEEQYSSPPMH